MLSFGVVIQKNFVTLINGIDVWRFRTAFGYRFRVDERNTLTEVLLTALN